MKFSIQAFLASMSKLPDELQSSNQIERYQIAGLIKQAQHSITQIASLIGRDKSTISRELSRNAGSRGYRPKQASALSQLQWSPYQIASRLRVIHRTLYQHLYADNTQGGNLWKNLPSWPRTPAMSTFVI